MGDHLTVSEGSKISQPELNGLLRRIIMGLQGAPSDANNWGDWTLHSTSPKAEGSGGGRDKKDQNQMDLLAQLNSQLLGMGLQQVKRPTEDDASAVGTTDWPFQIGSNKAHGTSKSELMTQMKDELAALSGTSSGSKPLQIKECWTPETVVSHKNPTVTRRSAMNLPSALTRNCGLAVKEPIPHSSIGFRMWPQKPLAGRLASAKQNVREWWSSSSPSAPDKGDTASIISSSFSLESGQSGESILWEKDKERRKGCLSPRIGPWTMFIMGMLTGALLVIITLMLLGVDSDEQSLLTSPISSPRIAPQDQDGWERKYRNAANRIAELEKQVNNTHGKTEIDKQGHHSLNTEKPQAKPQNGTNTNIESQASKIEQELEHKVNTSGLNGSVIDIGESTTTPKIPIYEDTTKGTNNSNISTTKFFDSNSITESWTSETTPISTLPELENLNTNLSEGQGRVVTTLSTIGSSKRSGKAIEMNDEQVITTQAGKTTSGLGSESWITDDPGQDHDPSSPDKTTVTSAPVELVPTEEATGVNTEDSINSSSHDSHESGSMIGIGDNGQTNDMTTEATGTSNSKEIQSTNKNLTPDVNGNEEIYQGYTASSVDTSTKISASVKLIPTEGPTVWTEENIDKNHESGSMIGIGDTEPTYGRATEAITGASNLNETRSTNTNVPLDGKGNEERYQDHNASSHETSTKKPIHYKTVPTEGPTIVTEGNLDNSTTHSAIGIGDTESSHEITTNFTKTSDLNEIRSTDIGTETTPTSTINHYHGTVKPLDQKSNPDTEPAEQITDTSEDYSKDSTESPINTLSTTKDSVSVADKKRRDADDPETENNSEDLTTTEEPQRRPKPKKKKGWFQRLVEAVKGYVKKINPFIKKDSS